MGTLQGSSRFFREGPPSPLDAPSRTILDYLAGNLAEGTVLELGGGVGAYSLGLRGRGIHSTVADINAAYLETARSVGLETILVRSDQELPDASWDNVVLVEVLEHVQDPRAFLASACRVARKRVIFTIPCSRDFEELFGLGLSYGHMAVTDHLHHFGDEDFQELTLPWKDRMDVRLSDHFVHAGLFDLVSRCVQGRLARWFCLLPLRIARLLGRVPPRYPTRYMATIRIG